MAWLFDAVTDKVLVNSGWSGTAFTLCMWVKRTSATANAHGNNPWRAWTGASAGGTTVAGMDVQGASRTTVVAYDSTFTQTVGGDIRSDAGWHPVAVVVNGTAWALFYSTGTDPAVLTKVTATRATGATVGSFTLSDATPDWFDGAIANVKIFSRALSDAEVSAELATYAQVSATNLIFRASLSTSSNTPETGTAMTAGSTAVTVVAGPAALDPDPGVLAVTLQRPVSAITGTVKIPGALAATLQLPIGSLQGSPIDRAQLAVSLPLPVAAIAGQVRTAGTLAAILPLPIGTIAGTHPAVGVLAAVLPLPLFSAHEYVPPLVGTVHAGQPTSGALWTPGEPEIVPVWTAGQAAPA
jgi:hypothetical protein